MKRLLAIVFAAALLATGCDYKDLCYRHPHTAGLEIEVDWSKSEYLYFDDGTLPTGMTVLVYNREGGRHIEAKTNNIDRITLNLEEGVYDMLLFNQSFTEFGSFAFENRNSYADICVNSVESRVSWYMRSRPSDETSRTPEWLAVARIEGVEITKEMITEYEQMRKTRTYTTAWLSDRVLRLQPRCALEKAKVVVNVNGFENLASVRAVVSGFARGYYLAADQNSTAKTGYLMNGWKVDADPADYRKATISTTFQLFGLPADFGATADEVLLHLECLLVDGETIKSFDFPVGDILQRVDADYVEVLEDITIEVDISLPYTAPPGSTTGGFAISVDDWDEELLISVPIE